MFVHFGGKKWASLRETIGIFSLDAIKHSAVNKEYLEHIHRGKNRDLRNISSIIIMKDEQVLYSPICSLTLIKRVQEIEKKITSINCGVK